MSPPTGTALPHFITVESPYLGVTGEDVGEGVTGHVCAGQGDAVATAFMTACCQQGFCGGLECWGGLWTRLA